MVNPSLLLKDILRWMYWGPGRLLVRTVPRAASYRLVWLAAVCGWLTAGRKAALMRRWLKRVTGGTASTKQVVDIFIQYYRNSLDALLYDKLSPANIDQFVTYEGLNNLSQALRGGKGVILLHPHFGNEECLMPAIGHKGFPASQVASRWEPVYLPGRLFALFNRIRQHAWRMRIGTRERLPVGFVYIDEGLRNIYRLLRRNEILLLALDGREGISWQDVPFLGMTAMISPGPMKIARSTGAAVLPTVIMRTGLCHHTVHIGEPLRLTERSGDAAEAVRADTVAALRAFEPHIKKYPSQYAKFMLLGVKLFKEETGL